MLLKLVLAFCYVLFCIWILYSLSREVLNSWRKSEFKISQETLITKNKNPSLYWALILSSMVFVCGMTLYLGSGLMNLYLDLMRWNL
jgi:hypothetical protein